MAGRKYIYKTCSRCGGLLPETEFYKRAASRDGLQAMCKVCSDRVAKASISKIALPADGKKVCAACGERKPAAEFFRNKNRGDGTTTECKICMTQRYKVYLQDPTNRQRYNETRKRKQAAKKVSLADQVTRRKFRLPKNWSYDAVLAQQGGGCAICGTVTNFGRRLAVDHCHRTNQVRGLLCTCCNQALGQLHHDPNLLLKAIHYLDSYQSGRFDP